MSNHETSLLRNIEVNGYVIFSQICATVEETFSLRPNRGPDTVAVSLVRVFGRCLITIFASSD